MEVRVRKNIDFLTKDELLTYVHALQRMIDISAKDPDSIDGYTYFEQLHDGSAGPCEHYNDTFLGWHRIHLWEFEEALRRSDPPRTANVTIPYWDWSAYPTGARYPNAFEDQATILYRIRNDTAICKAQGPAGCAELPFPRYYLEADVLSVKEWSSSGAIDPKKAPPPSFGGYAGGESDCKSAFGKSPGVVENPPHDAMHGNFIGGDMADPSTAAMDPIFWSFHGYIDLLWWQWQRMAGHQVTTGTESQLCGLFLDREHHPDKRWRVKHALDVEGQLHYTYDYVAAPGPKPPTPLPGQAFRSHPGVDFVLSARKAPELVRSMDLVVPQPSFKRAQLNFDDVKVQTPFSYGADIYLVPGNQPFTPLDREFRRRYLLNILYSWKGHSHGHHHAATPQTRNLAVDVTRGFRELASTHAGERWSVHVALARIDSSAPRHQETMRAIRDEEAGRLDFGSMSLTLD